MRAAVTPPLPWPGSVVFVRVQISAVVDAPACVEHVDVLAAAGEVAASGNSPEFTVVSSVVRWAEPSSEREGWAGEKSLFPFSEMISNASSYLIHRK